MKNLLTTALCALLALLLVLFGLGWGAGRGWQEEYARLEEKYLDMKALEAAVAANLQKVALRYLPQGDEHLGDDPRALGSYLSGLPQVQASPRDAGYVDSLTRQMDYLDRSGAGKVYAEAAADYDRRLTGTFSGKIAQWRGVKDSQAITGTAAPVAELPEKNGDVNDFANVLSPQLINEVSAFVKELDKKTGVKLTLSLVHFLDGQQIGAYAQALSEKWQLGENDLLILLAVGEDNYYAWAGAQVEKKLPSDSRQILLSRHLQAPFLAQRYDGALTAYIPALAEALEKAYGKSLTLTGSLAPAAAAALPAKGFDWSQLLVYEPEDVRRVDEQVEDKVRQLITGEEDSGFSLVKTLIIAYVLWLIFGKKKARRGCAGCGCAPIGWILASLGLQKFFDRD